jgi:ubiquinone/menaquinone biosynthesis C-methylase UbiE
MVKKAAGYQAKEREFFDNLVAETGETWWGNNRPAADIRMRRRVGMLATELGKLDDPLVLEIGCGTGFFSRYVLEQMPDLRLVGSDISPKSIDAANERWTQFPNARFEVMDATALPYPDASYDAVIGCSILHHLPAESSLKEAFRVLKPGGLLWFSEPNMMNPHILLEKNVRAFGKLFQATEDETAFFRWSLAKMLRTIGFDAVSVQPYDFLHPILPRVLLPAVDRIGRVFEVIPLVREISGCLVIRAGKPAAPVAA